MRSAVLLSASVLAIIALGTIAGGSLAAQTPTDYTLSFPDAVHHVMQVDATFYDVPPGPFYVQMSRSSPGRYAAFEFVADLFKETFTDDLGKTLIATRPNVRSWVIANHGRTIHASYSVFGDQGDGTFLAVDVTHARINIPATFLWARGFDSRGVQVNFVLPAGSKWKVATQLYTTQRALSFTAPNLQYLMDSPIELSDFSERTFSIPALQRGGKTETFRVVAHHQGTNADLDGYVANLQKIIREEQAIFGEFPEYEPGSYTFLLDYLPWSSGDGMEHRNSTMISSSGTQLSQKWAVYSASHEFFHSWNTERIRPASLEPFSFEDVDMSGEMWLAEGFTNYYARLVELRTGLLGLDRGLAQIGGQIASVTLSPGTRYRSAVQMSRLAPVTDLATLGEPTDWNNTFVSYYTMGDVIALGLDLTLRARSDSRVTLDDFMRAMWRHYGKPGGSSPGLVAKPYTMADVRTCLAEVSGDKAFADDFVSRYIEGTEQIDFTGLLLHAGLVYESKSKDGTLGFLQLEKKGETLRVVGPTIVGSPAYRAGLDLDDELETVDGKTLASPDDVEKALSSHKAGDTVELVYKRRGQEIKATAELALPLLLDIVPIESNGGSLSKEQRSFRDAWLQSKR
ncbi:M61 family metallopeptidase [Granulicella arctica]|uniref:M61 family metallopeptidase n=1 Tax=Granulicella arctica TaxID=940613 RepID=UPI0021E00A8D|nr:PDZ domain-containing protein [Granulicella arctica]